MPDIRAGAALLDSARTFRPRIIAQRERIEASRRLPDDLTRELAAAGLLWPTFTDPHFLPEPRYRIRFSPRDSRPRGRSRWTIARTAIEALAELAVDQQLRRSTQRPRENHGTQIRVSQAESRDCREILRTDKFRCSSAVRPFNSPDRPPNSAVRQRSGIRIGPKYNQPLARSRLACEGPESAVFAVFSRRTGETALGLTGRGCSKRWARQPPRPRSPARAPVGGKVVKVDRVEWLYIPEAVTAVQALESGEVDYLENAPNDYAAALAKNPDITARGYPGFIGTIRFNHLCPPFDNVKMRQAVLAVADQRDYMSAMAGGTTNWRTCYSVYACEGERVVLLDPADIPQLHAEALVTEQLLKKLGLNVELAAGEWGTIVKRVNVRHRSTRAAGVCSVPLLPL